MSDGHIRLKKRHLQHLFKFQYITLILKSIH